MRLLDLQGDFIIAHCGGFHSFFNTLIKAVNLVAKLLGHRIRWWLSAGLLLLLSCSGLSCGSSSRLLHPRLCCTLPSAALSAVCTLLAVVHQQGHRDNWV